MEDKVFDERLRAAIYRAAESDYMIDETESASSKIIDLSPRMKRSMRKMLTNPKRFVRDYHRPAYLRVLRMTAMIVVMFSLTLGAVMAVSPTVRAAIVRSVRSWYGDHVEYTIRSEGDNDWVVQLGYIPKEMLLDVQSNASSQSIVMYENSESVQLFIIVAWDGTVAINNEDVTITEQYINGNKAEIYHSLEVFHPNLVLLYYEKENVIVSISSTIEIEELIRIAENIQIRSE
jgi:hypothetical protein